MSELPCRKKNRLLGYDYSNNGAYYVTVCANNHQYLFGEIKNKVVGGGLVPPRMGLSIIGEIINNQWMNIKNQFSNVMLDEFIIMPNHIHGILFINNNRDGASPSPTYLGQIIGSFKSRCVVDYLNYIKKNQLNTCATIWQRSFYDHIIRDESSLHKIREYIQNNSLTWDKDIENPDRIVNAEKITVTDDDMYDKIIGRGATTIGGRGDPAPTTVDR